MVLNESVVLFQVSWANQQLAYSVGGPAIKENVLIERHKLNPRSCGWDHFSSLTQSSKRSWDFRKSQMLFSLILQPRNSNFNLWENDVESHQIIIFSLWSCRQKFRWSRRARFFWQIETACIRKLFFSSEFRIHQLKLFDQKCSLFGHL